MSEQVTGVDLIRINNDLGFINEELQWSHGVYYEPQKKIRRYLDTRFYTISVWAGYNLALERTMIYGRGLSVEKLEESKDLVVVPRKGYGYEGPEWDSDDYKDAIEIFPMVGVDPRWLFLYGSQVENLRPLNEGIKTVKFSPYYVMPRPENWFISKPVRTGNTIVREHRCGRLILFEESRVRNNQPYEATFVLAATRETAQQ